MLKTVKRGILTTALAALVVLGLMPATSAFAAARFPDVDYTQWYADGVGYCNRHGMINGYDNGNFGVGNTLTRAQLATILWRNANTTTASSYDASTTSNATGMSDVDSYTWYTGAANWAVDNGVIGGYDHPDGSKTFGPNDAVTLEQMVKILGSYRDKVASESADDSLLLSFIDGESVSTWARHQVAWGVEVGLVSGYDNGDGTHTLSPQEGITRERAATILARACRGGVMDGGPKVDTRTLAEVQEAYNKASEEYQQMQYQADNADAQRAKGSVGFFEALGDYDAEKIFQSTQVASGTGTSADGRTFASYTHIGAEGDATSLENLRAAIELLREGNQLRTTDNNFTGLTELYVTNDLMALGEMNANWITGAVFMHPGAYGQEFFDLPLSSHSYMAWGENIAAGWRDPYAGWYTSEKAVYDAGGQGVTGHYTNIVGNFNATGYGHTTIGGAYGVYDAQEFGYAYSGAYYHADVYIQMFDDYYDSIVHADEIAAQYKAAFNQAQWDLEDVQAD